MSSPGRGPPERLPAGRPSTTQRPGSRLLSAASHTRSPRLRPRTGSPGSDRKGPKPGTQASDAQTFAGGTWGSCPPRQGPWQDPGPVASPASPSRLGHAPPLAPSTADGMGADRAVCGGGGVRPALSSLVTWGGGGAGPFLGSSAQNPGQGLHGVGRPLRGPWLGRREAAVSQLRKHATNGQTERAVWRQEASAWTQRWTPRTRPSTRAATRGPAAHGPETSSLCPPRGTVADTSTEKGQHEPGLFCSAEKNAKKWRHVQKIWRCSW